MPKQPLLFFIAFILYHFSFSQERFESAILITSNKDTSHCYIDNQDWLTNPKFINVKNSVAEESHLLPISQIESFTFINADSYVSRKVLFHYYTESIEEIQQLKDTLVTTDTLLLRVLVGGRASLYLFTDNKNLNHFFIEKRGMKTDELVLQTLLAVDLSGRQYIETMYKYRQSLSYYMNDCPKVLGKLNRLQFNENDLKKLFVSYNQCISPQDSQLVAKKDKVKILFGPLVGLSRTSLKFKSEFSYSLNELPFSPSNSLTGGVFFNIVFPRRYYRFAFCNEFFLKKVQSTNNSIDANGNSAYEFYSFNFSYFKIASVLSFDFSNSYLRPYAKFGVGNSFAYQYNVTVHYPFQVQEVPSLSRIYEQSILGAVGLKWNKYLLELRFETGNGSSFVSVVKSTTYTTSLLIGYSF